MKNFASVVSEARRNLGLNQSELARRIGVTPQSVQAWESGKSHPRPRKVLALAKELGLPLDVLIKAGFPSPVFATEDFQRGIARELLGSGDENETAPPPITLDDMPSEWGHASHSSPRRIEVPLLTEVELGDGPGSTMVERQGVQEILFDPGMLGRIGVDPTSAVCFFVQGDSMEPVYPDGSIVGIDTASTTIKDGKVYALDHNGQLRLKLLHRLPGGGLKMRSFNRDEYPDEEYSADDLARNRVRVIGRVFYSQAIW